MEPKTVSFWATGDAWIDAGIIAFFDILGQNVVKIPPEISVNYDDFTIIAPYDLLQKTMYDLFKKQKPKYIEQTGNQVVILSDNDNGFRIVNKKTLVGIVNMLFSGGDLKAKYVKAKFPTKLSDKYQQMKDSYSGNKKIQFKIEEKKGQKYIYKSEPNFNWSYDPRLMGTSETCSFCGRAEFPCSQVHSNNYPFTVGTKNFRNFFSNLSGELVICPFCELASLLATQRVFFHKSIRNERLFLALPAAYELTELQSFWQDIRSFLLPNGLSQNSNYLGGNVKYRGLYESVLSFLYDLHNFLIKTKEYDAALQTASSKAWNFYLITKSNNTLSFDGYTHLSDTHRIFAIFQRLKTSGIGFKSLFDQMAIQVGNAWQTAIRDELAKRMLENKEIFTISERLIWSKEKIISGLPRFVSIYNNIRVA